MLVIALTRGKTALIDDADYDLISQYRWSAKPGPWGWYAMAGIRRDGKNTTLYMHRLILGNPASHVDHRNGNGLDNTRANLRLATASQNQQNSRPRRGASSRYKGVFLDRGMCRAAIGPAGHRKYLGTFASEEAAAVAYDAAAREMFGEWAQLNFPEESPAGPCDFASAARRGSAEILPLPTARQVMP